MQAGEARMGQRVIGLRGTHRVKMVVARQQHDTVCLGCGHFIGKRELYATTGWLPYCLACVEPAPEGAEDGR